MAEQDSRSTEQPEQTAQSTQAEMRTGDLADERRTQILEAALTVFAREGLHDARMEDIATTAGISKGAVYLYYKSKDAVIEALLRNHVKDLSGRAHDIVVLGHNVAQVRAQLEAYGLPGAVE